MAYQLMSYQLYVKHERARTSPAQRVVAAIETFAALRRRGRRALAAPSITGRSFLAKSSNLLFLRGDDVCRQLSIMVFIEAANALSAGEVAGFIVMPFMSSAPTVRAVEKNADMTRAARTMDLFMMRSF
jgi:hypothetical protein